MRVRPHVFYISENIPDPSISFSNASMNIVFYLNQSIQSLNLFHTLFF